MNAKPEGAKRLRNESAKTEETRSVRFSVSDCWEDWPFCVKVTQNYILSNRSWHHMHISSYIIHFNCRLVFRSVRFSVSDGYHLPNITYVRVHGIGVFVLILDLPSFSSRVTKIYLWNCYLDVIALAAFTWWKDSRLLLCLVYSNVSSEINLKHWHGLPNQINICYIYFGMYVIFIVFAFYISLQIHCNIWHSCLS